MRRVAGLFVLVGTGLQTVALSAVPLAVRNDVLGTGPFAWAWLIGFMFAFLTGFLLLAESES